MTLKTMLLSSWTRAARGKSAPRLASSVSTSCTSKTNLSRPFTPCRPQRRNSSSKPSNPQNGDPSPLTAPSDVESKKTLSTSPSSTSTRKRLAPRTSRQKIREAILETPQIRHNGIATALPAVPSTKNLHPHGTVLRSCIQRIPLAKPSNYRHPRSVLLLHP